MQQSFEGSFDTFMTLVRSKLNGEAAEKGYAVEGRDGRPLVDFIHDQLGAGHATGEAVYKVIRWTKRRDPNDLFKAAAWCFLEWDRERRRTTEPRLVTRVQVTTPGNHPVCCQADGDQG